MYVQIIDRILRTLVCGPAQLECLFVRLPAYSACVCVFVCGKKLSLEIRFLKEYPMKKTDFLNKFPEKNILFTYVGLNIHQSLLKKFM